MDKEPPPIRRKKWIKEDLGDGIIAWKETDEDVEIRGVGSDLIIIDDAVHINHDMFMHLMYEELKILKDHLK